MEVNLKKAKLRYLIFIKTIKTIIEIELLFDP
jgi:hypothetical protein